MAKVTIPIGGGYYVLDSLPVSGQRIVNAYVRPPQVSTVTDAALWATPGLDLLASVDDLNTWRGSHEMAGIAYFIIGPTLYSLDRTVSGATVTWATTSLGTIAGTGLVSMDDNGDQLAIVVPGVNQYIYTAAAGLAAITDASFDGPVDWVNYINSYFNFGTTDGKKFITSPPNDGRGSPVGTPYDALDFNVAEADPDTIRGGVNFANTEYILGSQTTQAFQTIARTPAPFAPIPGAVYPVGLAAPFSLIKTQGAFMMIGAGENEGPAIWRFDGNGYQKINTDAVDGLLGELSDTELLTVDAWTYANKGAYFVGWALPDTCLIYNLVTKKWHEQESFYDENDNPYRAAGMIKAYGEILVGDRRDGRIGKINTDTYTEYGELIKRFGVLRPFDDQGNFIHVAQLEIVMESGQGNSDVEDPQMRIAWSDDQGRTFGNELSRSFGKVGEYWKRAIWNRQGGYDRSAVLAWFFSEPAKMVIVKVEAESA